ncbi:hypothetical protein B5G22_11725, partial [Limosilactobacillus reuteri]
MLKFNNQLLILVMKMSSTILKVLVIAQLVMIIREQFLLLQLHKVPILQNKTLLKLGNQIALKQSIIKFIIMAMMVKNIRTNSIITGATPTTLELMVRVIPTNSIPIGVGLIILELT